MGAGTNALDFGEVNAPSFNSFIPLPHMKPALKVLSGFFLVLLPFWAQYGGVNFPAVVFVLSYFAGLAIWGVGYFQLIGQGTFKEVMVLFVSGLALFATMPPDISKDIYVYLLEGKLALRGITTYTDGAANLLDPFYVNIDPHWLDCPNQYGPVPLFFFQAVAWLGGDNIFMNIAWMKCFDVLWAICIFGLLRRIATAIQLNPVTVLTVFCLNPIFLIQGLGQMHIDLLSCVFVCVFILGIVQNRMWMVGLSIGLMGATKCVLFPLFWGLALIYAVYAWKQKVLNISALIASVLFSVAVLVVSYWPVWQGIGTILIPMAYHEHKEPVKSLVELLSYVFAYFLPRTSPDYSSPDPFLSDKIYWGYQLKPIFQAIALLLAARLAFSLIQVKNIHQLFYGFSRIMLLVFIVYSPVMHAWYFLFVLPFFALSYHQTAVVWYASVVFFFANTYELGLTVGGQTGSLVMVVCTILSILSYFIYFKKFYLSTESATQLSYELKPER